MDLVGCYNNRFFYTIQDGIIITICGKTKYVNMSKIIKHDTSKGGHPKRLEGWFQTVLSQTAIENIYATKNVTDKLYFTIMDVHNNHRGTYCHKEMIPYILGWCSDNFMKRIPKIVQIINELDSYIDMNYKEEN